MYLIGAGSQAYYIVNIIHERNDQIIEKIFDPIGKKVGKILEGIVIEDFNISKIEPRKFVVVCLANNNLKKKIVDQLKNKDCFFNNYFHKKAVISKMSSYGIGNIINPNAIIQPYARIGNFCMIHCATVIEHNCTISDFVNLSPGVKLCGYVSVGEKTNVFTGSIVAPQVKIGENSIIGAGSVVLKDIPDNVVAYGNPCKVIKYREEK